MVCKATGLCQAASQTTIALARVWRCERNNAVDLIESPQIIAAEAQRALLSPSAEFKKLSRSKQVALLDLLASRLRHGD
jgi:hypothetical protein